MSKLKHTPAPWEIVERVQEKSTDDWSYYVKQANAAKMEESCIRDYDSVEIPSYMFHNEVYYPEAPSLEDAKYIVKCVNEHEALQSQANSAIALYREANEDRYELRVRLKIAQEALEEIISDEGCPQNIKDPERYARWCFGTALEALQKIKGV